MGSKVENEKLFQLAVEAVLNGWTALQLAVEHGFGGRESKAKAEWLVTAINQWFSENSGIEIWEVEEFLAEILSTEFDTVADDGSLNQVSQQICQYFKQCQDGKHEAVRSQINMLPKAALQQCMSHSCTDDDDDDDDDGEFSEETMTEQLSEINLSEEQSGACALPMHLDQSVNCKESECPVDMESNADDHPAEDTEWTVVRRPKGKKKPR